MPFFDDPRALNIAMIALSVLAAARWAMDGHWNDVVYWLAAATLTGAVTFGHMH